MCVGKITIIGSDNSLSPGRRQAIITTDAGLLLIGYLETNFSEIVIGVQTFAFKEMHLKMSSAKWRPLGLGLNVLNTTTILSLNAVGRRLRWCLLGSFTDIHEMRMSNLHPTRRMLDFYNFECIVVCVYISGGPMFAFLVIITIRVNNSFTPRSVSISRSRWPFANETFLLCMSSSLITRPTIKLYAYNTNSEYGRTHLQWNEPTTVHPWEANEDKNILELIVNIKCILFIESILGSHVA